MASKSRSALNTQATTTLPDNTSGAITPALLRTMVQDTVDSCLNLNNDDISALSATTSVTGTDTLLVSQGGTTKKVPISQLPTGSGGGTWGSITGTLSSQTDLNSSLTAKELLTNKATNLASPDNTKYPTTLAVSTALASTGNIGGQRTFQTATVTSNAVTLDGLNKAMSNFQIINSTNITFNFVNISDGDEVFVKLTTTANITLTFTGVETIFYNTPISGSATTLTGASSTSIYHLAIKKIGSNYTVIIQQVKI